MGPDRMVLYIVLALRCCRHGDDSLVHWNLTPFGAEMA